MDDIETDDDPQSEGYDAYLAGKGIDTNPYDPEDAPDMNAAWNDGWLEAELDAEEENG